MEDLVVGEPGQAVAVQVRDGIGGEVAVGNLQAVMGRGQALHDSRGQLAADGGGAGDAGVDVEQFHGLASFLSCGPPPICRWNGLAGSGRIRDRSLRQGNDEHARPE